MILARLSHTMDVVSEEHTILTCCWHSCGCSLWTDGNQTRAFGGKLDLNKSPYRSYFKRLRRVLCDQKLPSDPAQAAAALGPSWLYASSACSHFPAGSATSPPLSPAQQASSSASGLGNAAAGSVIAESGSVTAAAAPMPSLTDFTPNGKTLVTNLATPGGSSQSASSSQLCLELWRGPSSGGSVSKVGIYACSSHSPVWLYDPFKQTLSVRSVGSGCLRDLSGQVVYMACSTGDDSASQQWQLTADGHLRSKTGLCLGLGGPETRHYLVNVTCGASKELEWKPGGASSGHHQHVFCSLATVPRQSAHALLGLYGPHLPHATTAAYICASCLSWTLVVLDDEVRL